MNIIIKAKLIAKTAHAAIQQKRKYSGLDYIVHPAEVASIVSSVTNDEATIAAAWLHDVVEDTGLTIAYIRNQLNPEIANIVAMVTDVSKKEDGNRATRKKIDRDHLSYANEKGCNVKLADMISNGKDIKKNDKDFSIVYFKEMGLLLPLLKKGNKVLYNRALRMIVEYRDEIENERLRMSLKTGIN